jgi:Mrp family chromosome partitioning ATPase/capsular polysaccharide biosynthesis protein
MEPTYYLQLLRRRWVVVAILAAAGIALGLASSVVASGEGEEREFYAATHTLVADGFDAQTDNGRSNVNYEQVAYFAKLGQVPDRVAEQVGGNPVQLASRVALTPVPTGNALEITATGTNPDEIEQLADVYGSTLLAFLAERDADDRTQRIARKQTEIDRLSAEYDRLQGELAIGGGEDIRAQAEDLLAKIGPARNELLDLEAEAGQPPALSTLQDAQAIKLGAEQYAAQLAEITAEDSDVISARDAQIQAAQSGSGSAASGPMVRAAMGGFAGLIAGVVLILVLDRFDPRLRTKEEVEEAFGLPVLAEIPLLSRAQLATDGVIAATEPRSRVAEAYRLLRSALLFSWAHAEPVSPNGAGSNGAGANGHGDTTPIEVPGGGDDTPVILVTSPGPAEGKTSTTANLAVLCAEAGYRVLALNCDYRRPRLHHQLGVAYEPRRVLPTAIPEVFVVPDVMDHANIKSPAAMVEAQREVIEMARGMFDVIVVDTAPLLTTNDAAEILGLADMVVVAARADRTTGDAADRAAELLERRDAHVVGAVLVGARSGRSGRYYYYAQNSYYDGDTKGGGESSGRSADETAIFDAGMASTPSGHPASPTEG